ncbi:AAA family ATPase [Psychroserpens ponticola]|uniref:AAA family ATPase n=1 Tax=Psychroserpens ponticola TaxID=2932268 RepID=A0ABY7RSX0_9FLAO|nr:AAA family ATPase [Psychroserpens ponticola]WCO00222.1 AAA family ATPase [Psychroserpens ponticola]
MFKLKDVEIENFWGQHSIKSDFHEDVNIFIGRNGTGKTTFINLLQAVITVDLEMLHSLQFEKITINLKNKNKNRKIEVLKIADNLQFKEIRYKIGTQKYTLPIIANRELKYLYKRNSGRLHPKFYREIQEIKDTLKKLINISYLSVNRDISDEFKENRREDISNIIDARLEELIGDLTTYQLQLETEHSKLSKKFQEDVLRSMLFNEEFDYVNTNIPIKLNLREIGIGLRLAFRGLGILDDDIEGVIESHLNAIKKAATAINEYQKDNEKSIYPNDVTPLTLLRRTRRINQLSEELEESKKKIFKRLDDFINLLNEFHDTKYFSLQDSQNGGISVIKDDMNIPISQLSSGEKQLIILLTEALLQKGQETLFIADEPELSLHIEWQRKVISSIRKLNPNSQVIVATHSPEIVGKFKENVINMEKIING